VNLFLFLARIHSVLSQKRNEKIGHFFILWIEKGSEPQIGKKQKQTALFQLLGLLQLGLGYYHP